MIYGFATTQLESDQAVAHLGSSVAGAGDVNGDGYDDVIVGAPLYDAGEVDEGAAFVFLGRRGRILHSLTTRAAAQLESNQESGELGSSVAGAGDVNGDGYDDVIVGANLYDAGEANEGAAFVFLGSATGIADGSPATAAAQLELNRTGSFTSITVAGAGDVNGDGYDDVIVGANRYGAGEANEGAAFVFLGSAAGVADGSPATAAAQLESNQAEARLGISVAGAGDVNGDGYDDVIVGAYFYDAGEANEGAAFVFLGSAAGIADGSPATAAARLESNQVGVLFGWGVAGAGDVDGDGYDDVIASGAGGWGAAFVFLGSATGIAHGNPGTAASRLQSEEGNTLGPSVASAGDVNGDSYDDVVVGGQNAAFVFLGSATGIASGDTSTAADQIQLRQLEQFGQIVAGAGDVNGDAYDDVIVGDPYFSVSEWDERGAAFVFHGRTCGNGVDDDTDGLIDYPTDPGCVSAADLSERGADCGNGVDDDGDDLADYPADPGCRSPADLWESGACENGADDDGDTRTDYPADPGCTDLADTSELGSVACDNDADDDGDGRTDYPYDPSCTDPEDDSEIGTAACDNNVDDDADGRTDYPSDPSCTDLADDSEVGACNNSLDDDGDGRTDYPSDPSCTALWDPSEIGGACDNNVDDDGDGRIDYPSDPSCTSLGDPTEIGAACDNNVDDDGDGGVDYPADPGCQNLSSLSENPQCQDGVNNDGQAGIDFDGGASVNGGVPIDVADPECNQPWVDWEAVRPVLPIEGWGCSGGPGPFWLVLPPLFWLRRRRES